jgi:hypothetical protein
MYDAADAPMKSTQQLNVDWAHFENHTFFMSAEAKVNLAFDQIINGFPFDGSRKDVEEFFERLTGYDKWVFNEFPKHRGQLRFSGGPVGSYVVVEDVAGGLYPELAKNKTGESILNPKDGASLSVEMQLFLPKVTNDCQVVCQKLSGSTQGFSLYVSASSLTSSAEAMFSVVSGTTCLTVPFTLDKGLYNHLCVSLNREGGLHYLEAFQGAVLSSSTQARAVIGDMDIDDSQFIIGSGTTLSLDGTTFTPKQTLSGTIDELRVFHSTRTESQQALYAQKALYSTSDLKLYYRFNEPPMLATSGSTIDSIVIDSSGNALHSYVTNFTGSLRENSALDALNPMVYEKDETIPVLFPKYAGVVDFNVELLASASEYDRANPNLITRLVPEHYLLEGATFDGFDEPECNGNDAYSGEGIPGEGKIGNVQIMLSLLYVYARFFDELKLFVDAFSTIGYVDYDTNLSMPNNFLRDVISSYGFELPPLFNDSTIEQYIRAENIDPMISTGTTPLKSVQHELLRRVLINLPDVIRSKGTQHSIKAFLRTIGIDPDNSMRIREYGGPTSRHLTFSREKKRDVMTMVEFSTSSYFDTGILSGSRVEVGYPEVSGTMVMKDIFAPHGVSDSVDDGMFTSGSWTIEATYAYKKTHVSSMTNATQSLVRMNLIGCNTYNEPVGSGIDPLLVANLLAISSSVDPRISLYIKPTILNRPIDAPLVLTLDIPTGTFFDGDVWQVSFGCQRNDEIDSLTSSSYFLRVACQNNGEIWHSQSTSSYYDDSVQHLAGNPDYPNVLRSKSLVTSPSHDPHLNMDGVGITLSMGTNQSIASGPGGDYFLLNTTDVNVPPEARATDFNGMASNLRFWSKALTTDEWKEHVLNYNSRGVHDPLVNFNFEHVRTGSFERLRLETLCKQDTRRAIATASLGILGTIEFLDFSQNGIHCSGSGFPIEKDCVKPTMIDFSYVSPRFDEAVTDEKVRIRSYNDQALVDATPWAAHAPVYELLKSEEPMDDTRFSVEFSLTDALDRDIVTMFATLDSFDNALGAPELLNSPDYPDLARLQDIYFHRIGEKLNFKAFHEFFRWFDSSIGTFISQLVPKKTNFKGVNFTVESHMLERSHLEYYQNEQYLSETSRVRFSDSLVLQQIFGTIKKY